MICVVFLLDAMVLIVNARSMGLLVPSSGAQHLPSALWWPFRALTCQADPYHSSSLKLSYLLSLSLKLLLEDLII